MYTDTILLKTKFGKFKIRNIDWDVKVASPSFERLDLNELLSRISQALTRGHKVLFIDVGAQFGKFSVAIANHFNRQSKDIFVLAFEPEPDSFMLLKENFRINVLKHAQIFPVALSSKKSVIPYYYYEPMRILVSYPTTQRVHIRTNLLDHYVKNLPDLKNTEVFVKLDVEGHEIEVLKGSKKLIRTAYKTTLLVEDSLVVKTRSLVRYLSKNSMFLTKKTPYNSFWELH